MEGVGERDLYGAIVIGGGRAQPRDSDAEEEHAANHTTSGNWR